MLDSLTATRQKKLLKGMLVVLLLLIICRAATTKAAPTNIIVNGGFEQNLFSWTKYICSSCSLITVEQVSEGSKSLLVDTTGTSHGSYVAQSLPTGIQDFEVVIDFFRATQEAEGTQRAGSVVELLANWNPDTGNADIVSQVQFSVADSGHVRLQAWNTESDTTYTVEMNEWHELRIIGHWAEKRQYFFIDDRLMGVITSDSVISPSHIVIGDAGGWNNGRRIKYYFDDVRIYAHWTPMSIWIVSEARLDIGMPYNVNRGCTSPYSGCGGPYHGFYAGVCTDLCISQRHHEVVVLAKPAKMGSHGQETDLLSNHHSSTAVPAL